MKTPKLILLMLGCLALASFFIVAVEDEPVLTTALYDQAGYVVNNDPVLMVGCKTFHPPLPKKVEHEVVAKRFVNLLCALEVPPPFAAIEYKKRLGSH